MSIIETWLIEVQILFSQLNNKAWHWAAMCWAL